MEGQSHSQKQFSQTTQKNIKSEQDNQSEYSENTISNKQISQNNFGGLSELESGKMKSETQNEVKGSMSEINFNDEDPITQQDINQLKKIFAEFRDFKIDKQNKIELVSPNKKIVGQAISLWKKRTIKSPNFVLTLVLQKLPQQLQKSKIIQFVELLASIKLVIDGQQIFNKKSIHGLDGNTYYEGIQDEYMMITKTNGDSVDIYEGDVKGRIQNGQGSLFHNVNGKLVWHYYGEFVDGKRQGKGKQSSSKGLSYQGEFKNDFKHGKGIQIVIKKRKHPQPNQDPFIQKNKYIGEFYEGFKHGEGVQITSHGEYNGQWVEGVKQGKGKITYKNGHVYQGQWSNNCFNGEGVYTEAIQINGEPAQNKYTGEFKEGFYHGKGNMQYANGDKYEGEWAFGKKQGEGMYNWADGDYYDGHWEKDSAEGIGAACFGGMFYDGQFHFGQKHGLGEQTDEQGNTIKAIWQNNKILKKLEVNGQIVEQQDDQN